MSKPLTLWITALAVLGMIAAGCGDDDSEETGDDTDVVADDTSGDDGDGAPSDDDAPADDDTPADDTTGDDTASDDTSADDATSEEVVLTDMGNGVTAESILIGHSSIDFETLNNNFGLDLAFQDFRPQMDAVVAWYNENGGVLGRQIEVIHEVFLPVGTTTADAACVKLVEDNEVFAVLNGFSGPGAETVNNCITDINETILVGGLPTAEEAARSEGRWISNEMSLERRNPAFVQLLDDAGLLEELGTVMVIGSNPSEENLVNGMRDALEGAGVEVASVAWVTASGDETATQGEVDSFIARAEADDVESIFLLGEGELRNIHFFRTAPQYTYLMGNGDRITDWQSIPPEGLQEGTRILTNNNPRPDDPALDECIAVVAEAQGVEILYTDDLPEGAPNYWSGASGACARMALFVQLAEAAGPDLTREAFVAALDNVPDLVVPGLEYVSLSSTKTDARDQLQLAEYDLATLTFEPLSELTDFG